ncbi:MAG: peptide deformylase [Candidatus Nitrospinota bacterium M3_3B_026]
MSLSVEIKEDSPLLEILTWPHPALGKKAEPIAEITGEMRALAARMMATMTAAPGLGLAAPQVGQSVRLIVVDMACAEEGETSPVAMINPEIIKASGEIIDEEGCLSVPAVFADVTRPEWLSVKFTDLDGAAREFEAEETLARCLAHEIDHLDGLLFWDRLSRLKRDWLKLKYKRASV